MMTVLSRETGYPFEYSELPISAVREQSADMAAMYEWFNRVGYDVPIGTLRREFPEVGWHTFEDWAKKQDWSALRLGE
jgi:hypothetical protein